MSSIGAFADAANSSSPVQGLTHKFYRYPARFSPEFARAAIKHFTRPGDLVLDPFMGSGTTLVEALSLGRSAIGTDINSLSVFLARNKTTIYPEQVLLEVERWIERLMPRLSTRRPTKRHKAWAEQGYQDNINNVETWRIRKLLEIAINSLVYLPSDQHREFARCILLKTAQWALDCRERIPETTEFRSKLLDDCNAQIVGAKALQMTVVASVTDSPTRRPFVQCLHRSAIGLEHDKRLTRTAPKLILTSPPYPGVHVLYHRWQVRGRRETPAPYWIANQLDGNGASYYTFGDRKQKQLRGYFDTLKSAFTSLARIADRETLTVQMVSFSDAKSQLRRYLDTMEEAGYEEYNHLCSPSPDGRLWREVPNRKWYALPSDSSREVVLIHRLAR